MNGQNELMGGLTAAMQPMGGAYENEAYAPTTGSIFNESRPVDTLRGRGGALGQFQFTPGSEYNLNIGGQHIGTATTEEEYRRLVQLAQQELARSGEKAQVTFEDSRLRAAGFPQFHVEAKQTNPVIDMVLPIAASLLIPGSGALLGAAKAAGGSLASSVLQGRAADDALLRAAISGGTAFGVGQIPGLDSLGSAKASTLASGKTGGLGEAAAQQVAGGTVGGLADDAIMTVVADRIGSGLGSAAAGALGGGLSNIAADLVNQASLGRLADSYDVQQPDELVVTGSRIPETGAGSALTGAAAGALPTVAAPATVEPGITVTAKPIADTALDEALAAGVGSALPQLAQNPLETDVPMSERVQDAPQEQTPEKKGGLGLLGKVTAGLTIADLLGKLLGGGGGGGNTLGPGAAALGTRASLDPVFGAQLPAPRAGGIFSPSSLAPRDMSGIDFARYGYGPAQSFFENVPRNADEYRSALSAATAPRPVTAGAGSVPVPPVFQQPFDPNLNTGAAPADAIRRLVPDATDAQITEYLATPEGAQFMQALRDAGVVTAAEGGMMAANGGAPESRDAYAVKGPGTGRSDEIPALLSDGEYVIDAETVAMLGDGSSEAGAKRLDDFRVSVRKHKGQNLAKGKFSANAKRPENYLSGGRV